jgi:uncharacterized membrane protein
MMTLSKLKGDIFMSSKTKTKSNINIKSICFIGLMAALVFVFTFTFKVPIGAQGYAHLGDAFIIVSTFLIGGKRASFSSALGAALADFVSGYTIWILPTFLVKFLMVVVLSLVAEKLFNDKLIGYIVGCIFSSIAHIAGYSLAWFIIGGKAGVITAFIPLVLQTIIGAVLGVVIIVFFQTSGVSAKLKKLAE